METVPAPELFPHVRIVMGMVIGLGQFPVRRFHLALVSVHLIYQSSWILRLFNTVT